MKKEELLNVNFETQKELKLFLSNFFNFKLANDEEIKKWPYKNELLISIENVIGKELYYKNEYVGIIEKCYFGKNSRGRESVLIESKNKKFPLTYSKVKVYNKFYEQEDIIDLHPSRKGIKFWSNGHILSEKDYKSLYYKTKEYRSHFEKSLNESLGTIGIVAPIQSKKVKEKISNTIKEKYGVNWFLERGKHYSVIISTMERYFGIDNLFKSYEWQIENVKKINKNFKETSKLEKNICNELDFIFNTENSFHKNSEKGQKIIIVNNNKFYKLDYYNEEYNFVVEILGDYWHCNPSIYEYDFYHKNKKKLAIDIWKGDKNRKDEIINLMNCFFVEIWEKDWNENKESILCYIKKIKNEIIKN
jgi:hypothetical protein